ncbi:hypothetical protein [Thermoleptolyngbya sp. PKUAC-SCTB121]|nr:hypothetical protein [Thermoleptolyngbya sp. PKUAC-SCTB121]
MKALEGDRPAPGSFQIRVGRSRNGPSDGYSSLSSISSREIDS